MSITVGLNSDDYLYGVVDGEKKVITKNILNFDFSKEFNIKTVRFTTTGKSELTYNAFPYFISYGTKIIGLYSDGDSHANSDRQIMIVGSKNSYGQSFDKTTFFENSTGVYDFSLLQGVLSVGQSIVLKIWTITNKGGVISATVNSTINVSGINYVLWGDVVTTGGVMYRTGYSSISNNFNSALFTSSDNGITWVFKSIIASGTAENGHIYNEAGLFYIGGGAFIAVVRDDSDKNGDNVLYIVKSLDFGTTWDAPVLLPENIRGRQPKLTRIFGSNNMALTIGKRTGSSGANADESIYYGSRTGVQMFISTDYGTSWGTGTMIDTIHSTDGGQPWALSWEANKIFIPYYARKSIDENPDIYSISLDVNGLEL